MNRGHAWLSIGLMLLTAAGAFAFRLPLLEQRPLHTDEAVHAIKAGILLESGQYEYNPNEYHGPTHYYGALPFCWFSGAHKLADTDIWMFRIVPALAGGLLVLLTLWLRDALGNWASLWAAIFAAISPAFVFYSRYYIQEILLVCFTFGFMVSVWRYSRSGRWLPILMAGLFAGLMHATKETDVLAFASMTGAIALTSAWAHFRHETPCSAQYLAWRKRLFHPALFAGLFVAGLVAFVILSGCFTNLRGPLDSILTYGNYIGRASADPSRTDGAHFHDHPWWFYLKMLIYTHDSAGPWWSEGLILGLATIGAVCALWMRKRENESPYFLRFVVFYTLFMTVGYSLIPYKTPWCMLSFLHGMILLAGYGVVSMLRAVRYKPIQGIVLVLIMAATAQLGAQSYRASFVYYADNRNPYVYAHSLPDIARLGQRAEELAQIAPEGHNLFVRVIATEQDYWPLPWYLRKFPNTGYWTSVPEDDVDADIIIASVDLEETLDAHLHKSYQREYYGLRPEVFLLVYIRQDLWDAFIATRQ